MVAGKVMGGVLRSIDDGGTVEDEVHIVIDTPDAGVRIRVADVETDDARVLRDVADVAVFLADGLVNAGRRGH